MLLAAFVSNNCAPTVSTATPILVRCKQVCRKNSYQTKVGETNRSRIKVSHIVLSHFRLSSGSDGSNRPPFDGGSHRGYGDDDSYFHQHASPLLAYALYLVSQNSLTARPLGKPSSFSQFLRSLRICHVILAVNIVVFIYQSMFAPSLLMAGAKLNSAIVTGQYYRLISSMFLHASTTHLLINSFSLRSTGPSVESWFGKRRFAALYLISGVCGNFLSLICTPMPAVGASGAIFGLVGASSVLLARHRKILGPRARRSLQSLVYIVIINFGMGLTPGSRIDNFGHLGGFLGGIAYTYLFGPRLVVRRSSTGRATIHDDPIIDVALRDIRFRFSQLQQLLIPR